MKLKTEEEIESLGYKIQDHPVTNHAFTQGYMQAQQDLLASASESFEEWKAHNLSCYESARIHDLCERSYQAAKLSQAKEIEALKKENEELKEENKKLQHQLEIQTKRVENLKKSNEFYAGRESWYPVPNFQGMEHCIDYKDIEDFKFTENESCELGGKLARECQAKDQELEKQLEESK